MKKNALLTACFIVLTCGLLLMAGCAKKQTVSTTSVPTTQQEAAAEQKTTPPETTVKEKGPEIPEVSEAQPQKPVQAVILQDVIRDINFDFDSSAVRADAREILRTNAALLQKHRFSSITIEGHCDERGTAEYNLALGQRRADETKQYLVNLGIQESLIQTVSYGKERPLDPGHDEEAWAKNRRAHFVVHP
jgi:peptidoglycan-associated lipoprotein